MGREVRYGSPLTATATATTDTTQTHSVFLSYFFKAILISSCVITPSPSVSNWENALMSACSVGFFQFVMSRRSAWKGKGRGSQVSWKVLGRGTDLCRPLVRFTALPCLYPAYSTGHVSHTGTLQSAVPKRAGLCTLSFSRLSLPLPLSLAGKTGSHSYVRNSEVIGEVHEGCWGQVSFHRACVPPTSRSWLVRPVA